MIKVPIKKYFCIGEGYRMSKIMEVEDALKLIKDGDTIGSTGSGVEC